MARKLQARAQSSEHEIAIPVQTKNVSLSYQQILDSVFSHHVVDIHKKLPMHNSDSKIPPDPAKISQIFHRSFYKQPKITVHSEGDRPISADDMIDEIITFSSALHRNRDIGPCCTYALIGRIGTGKSTLCCNLILRQTSSYFSDRKFIPLRIDIEDAAGKKIDSFSFFDKLLLSIRDAVRSAKLIDSDTLEYLYNIATEHQVAPTIDTITSRQFYYNSIKAFIGKIYDISGFRLLLFIDNIDAYYYLYERFAFSEEGEAIRRDTCSRLADIITCFQSKDGLLNCGAAVVFVMRRTTLEYLSAISDNLPGNAGEQGRFKRVYRIHRPKPEEVLNSRHQLLQFCSKNLLVDSKLKQSLSNTATKIGILLQISRSANFPGGSMVEVLGNLCHHGHRTLISHLAKFAKYDDVVSERFFQQHTPLLITFILNYHRRYSQSQRHFPNMFLVRNDVDAATTSYIPDSLKKPHRPSYWAKYLVAKYIFECQREQIATSAKEVLDIFCGTNGYESHIIELILGSLCQSDSSHIIQPVFKRDSAGSGLLISNIVMTKRGERLIGSACFDFIYLQLIIDDYMLLLPSCMCKELKFGSSDYSYLVSIDPVEYNASAKSMIETKCYQSLLFLRLLETSLKCEAIVHKGAFDALNNLGFVHEDMSIIRERILDQVYRILTKVYSNEDPSTNVPLIIDRIRESARSHYADIDDDILGHFGLSQL